MTAPPVATCQVCVTCIALTIANCWLLSLMVAVLAPQTYNGFTANEVDYWYPIRLCAREPAPSHEQYDSTMAFHAQHQCRAATGEVTCGQGNLICETRNCTRDAAAISSAPQCASCCGGTIQRGSAQCVFPFDFRDASSQRMVTHRSCATTSTSSASNTSAPGLHWCPTAVDAFHRPSGVSGECGGMCVQHDYVAASAEPTCEATCPADGASAAPINLAINRIGWGGDAGFKLGAPYKLVLFAYGHHVRTRMVLTTASGRELYRGEFARDRCLGIDPPPPSPPPPMPPTTPPSPAGATARRRRLEQREDDADSALSFDNWEALSDVDDALGDDDGLGGFLSTLHSRGRHLVSRRGNWLDDVLQRDSGASLRPKEGAAARWRGQAPTSVGGSYECADNVALRGNVVFQQGGCHAPNGNVTLPYSMMRAELGSPFTLEANDFPLRLLVLSANASLRGEEAWDAASRPADAPKIYATFYTEELDYSARYLMWVGVPVTWLLLSCCCCCACCLCSCLCATVDDDAKALSAHELADLASAMPDLPDDVDDDDGGGAFGEGDRRGGGRGRSRPRMRDDDGITPA